MRPAVALLLLALLVPGVAAAQDGSALGLARARYEPDRAALVVEVRCRALPGLPICTNLQLEHRCRSWHACGLWVQLDSSHDMRSA